MRIVTHETNEYKYKYILKQFKVFFYAKGLVITYI